MGLNRETQGDTVLMLVKLFVAFLMLLFVAVLGQDTFRSMLSEPLYTQEELSARTEERKRLRNIERSDNWDLVENGIHVKTGLKDDDNLAIVMQNCITCHSAKLITQNRATREGWQDMIRWMQESQGLQDLGIYEPKILDYLSSHYAPEEIGRRQNLNVEEIEWYVLDFEEN